jgi:hypothetical protein
MRENILRHYDNYAIDKQTIPLYLFLSGAGTGKSRSGLEFHKTALQCFDGTWFPKCEDPKLSDIEKRLQSALLELLALRMARASAMQRTIPGSTCRNTRNTLHHTLLIVFTNI